MRIRPTMSHAVDKAQYMGLLIEYYKEREALFDLHLTFINNLLEEGKLATAREENRRFIKELEL